MILTETHTHTNTHTQHTHTHTHTHSLTHSLTHTLTHSHTHTLTHSHTHTLTHSHTHTLTHSHTHTLTHSHTHTLTHSHTHTLTHSHTHTLTHSHTHTLTHSHTHTLTHSHTHTLTHSHTHTLTHSHTHTLTHSHTHTLTHSHTHTLTHSHTHTLTHSHTHTLTHSHTHTLTHSHTHTLTHSHTHTLTHSHTHTLTHSHTHTHTLTHSHTHTLTHSHTHTLTLSHSHTLTLSHSHTLTLSHSHTLTLSHSHTLTLSHSHTLTLSHSHTLTLSHSHTHTPTHPHTHTPTHPHTHTPTHPHTHTPTHPHTHTPTHPHTHTPTHPHTHTPTHPHTHTPTHPHTHTPTHSHTHTLTHSHTHTLTHSHTHTLTHSHTHTLTHSHTHTLTHSHTHTLTHSHTHTLTHSHTHTLTHSHTHTLTHSHTHTLTHSHTHTLTHSHTHTLTHSHTHTLTHSHTHTLTHSHTHTLTHSHTHTLTHSHTHTHTLTHSHTHTLTHSHTHTLTHSHTHTHTHTLTHSHTHTLTHSHTHTLTHSHTHTLTHSSPFATTSVASIPATSCRSRGLSFSGCHCCRARVRCACLYIITTGALVYHWTILAVTIAIFRILTCTQYFGLTGIDLTPTCTDGPFNLHFCEHRTLCRGNTTDLSRDLAFCGGAHNFQTGGALTIHRILHFQHLGPFLHQFELDIHRAYCRGVTQPSAHSTRAFCGGASQIGRFLILPNHDPLIICAPVSPETNRHDCHLVYWTHCQRGSLPHCAASAFCSGASVFVLFDIHWTTLVFCSGTTSATVRTPTDITFCGGVLRIFYNLLPRHKTAFSDTGLRGHPFTLTIATQCFPIVISWISIFLRLSSICDITFCGGVLQQLTPDSNLSLWTFGLTTGVGSHFFHSSLALRTSGTGVSPFLPPFYNNLDFLIYLHLLAFALVLAFFCSRQIHFQLQSEPDRNGQPLDSWSGPFEPPTYTPCVCGKSGPKSGRTWNSRIIHLFLLVAACVAPLCLRMDSRYGGEGFDPQPSWINGADPHAHALYTLLTAKPDGQTLPKGYGLDPVTQIPRKNSILKRSFRRAFTRACNFGSTWYRGQLFRRCDFPSTLQPPADRPPVQPRGPQPARHRQAPRGRLNIVHHNIGGLSSYRLDEIKTWANCIEADVVILTETRWGFQSEWSDSAWHHVHIGNASERSAGILVLIKTTVCPAARIGLVSLH